MSKDKDYKPSVKKKSSEEVRKLLEETVKDKDSDTYIISWNRSNNQFKVKYIGKPMSFVNVERLFEKILDVAESHQDKNGYWDLTLLDPEPKEEEKYDDINEEELPPWLKK